MEEKEFKVLPFDLKTAQAHPEWLYTREGCKARIICTDARCRNGEGTPIIALVTEGDEEFVFTYYADGGYCYTPQGVEGAYDLVIRKPRVRKVWVYSWEMNGERIVDNDIFPSLEVASAKANTWVAKDLQQTAQFHEIEISEE